MPRDAYTKSINKLHVVTADERNATQRCLIKVTKVCTKKNCNTNLFAISNYSFAFVG